MADAHSLMLYNTLTRRKEAFVPLDAQNVRMYVCGPTVYDYAHIGNARPVVVFDVLFRLLRQIYGAKHVTYVRNITDVDDKINARAAEEGVSIRQLTERTARQFHSRGQPSTSRR
jgi:cysteinyl-tRNA synthetase